MELHTGDLEPTSGAETFRLVREGGDEISIAIRRLRWNPEPEPEKFQLKFPPGVDILDQSRVSGPRRRATSDRR